MTGLFAGLAPAVLAVVAQAVVRLGRRALVHPALLALACASFVAVAVLAVPFPVVVGVAAGAGWALGRRAPLVRRAAGTASPPPGAAAPAPVLADDEARSGGRPERARTARILAVGIVLWAAPLVAAVTLLGTGSVVTEQGLFFSGTALVTFGGAYAVLAYVAERAVEVHGWLAPGEMVRGLALAETTPGPLILVVQFVAFVGAYRDPGRLDPWVAGLAGALVTTWVTFVPSFVFVFLGAPYVERLRAHPALAAGLAGITAAVVGVIASLALSFAGHTLFARTATANWGPVRVELPDLAAVRPGSLGIALVAAGLLVGLRWSVLRTLAVCALLGLLPALLAIGGQ